MCTALNDREPYRLKPHESAIRSGFDPAALNRLADEAADVAGIQALLRQS